MITKFGSQNREKIEDTDYILIKMSEDKDQILIKDKKTGNLERWFANDDHAGYTIEVEGIGFEFASSLLPSCDEYLAAIMT